MKPRQFSAQDIIECMTDGFVAFDKQWRYTYVNAHAARMFGTTPQALLGRTYLECFPDAQGTRFELAYRQAMRERIAVHIEDYYPPWGRWFENHIYPAADGISVFFHEITERKVAEQLLADNAAQLAETQQLARLGSWKWLAESGKILCSEELARIFGRERSTIDSLASFMACVLPEDRPVLVQAREQAVRRHDAWETEYRIVHPEGRRLFIRERGKVMLDTAGNVSALSGYAQDISSIRQAESELHRQQQLMGMIVDAMPINIYVKDRHGRYLRFNKEAERATGTPREEAIGKTDDDLFPEHIASTIRAEDRLVMETGETTTREMTLPLHGGSRHMLVGRSRLQLADEEASLLGFSIDITDRKESELRSEYLGSHDPLTGLPNRSLLQDRLEHAIAHAHRTKRVVAVLFFDLDRFKVINDSLGHKCGDELLCVLAQRLAGCIREGDTLARLGGDEFVIVLEDLESAGEAAFYAEEALTRIAQNLALEMQVVTPSASMGISLYPKDGEDSATLLKNADIAMYQAKKAGGNGLRFFDHVMNAQAMRRMLIESNLRRALDSGSSQVGLHYQPIVDLTSGRLIGMEALARGNFPDRSISTPDCFIPVAEETGLIVPLGEKLLRQACGQFARWQREADTDVALSVNLSVRQLGASGLVAMVRSALGDTGMDPALLQLEITETGLMHNIDHARRILHELAQMGIRLSIDDFGTGYSSLSYLKTLPIHKLKIDRSFVRDVVEDNDDASIVNAIIGLAHNLGLKVISEGVETREQMDFLRNHGCDEGQGYYFSRALDSGSMEALLVRSRNPSSDVRGRH
ncbi:sensor domain-containing protein [Massilia consociata]|uniref:EAL domain-containing protein n=1 Tax=Massilia consociata TaxID=760117 RepID=A0ABV6FEB8_9BURK